ncbi:MAG: hypothetical protein ACOH5I_23405 [Oligoflexus sp.]
MRDTLGLLILKALFALIFAAALSSCDMKPDDSPVQNKLNMEGSFEKELALFFSSKVPDEAHQSARPDFFWEYIQETRKQELQTYLQDHNHGYEAFTKAPVAFNGVPAVIFRLLPDILSSLWNPQAFEQQVGLFKRQIGDPLPHGLAFTKPPTETPSPLFVQLTCAACHTGRVEHPDGEVEIIVGAPSNTFDSSAYRTLVAMSVMSPAYTFENFQAALLSKGPGELYGPDRIMDEFIDKAIFLGSSANPPMGPMILEQFKQTIIQKTNFVQATLGAYSYQGDMRLLRSSPGRVEAFGFATVALIPKEEFIANPAATVVKYLEPTPSIARIMSVWRQNDRELAQWDGNIRNKLVRNLGAQLGVSTDPSAVNYENGVHTTPFVAELPAPVYPFPVDLTKAVQGKIIYHKACASCHEAQSFMSVDAVGTEPGRAVGLNAEARKLLVKGLRDSCKDQNNPDCQAADEDYIVPRQADPGYLSVPLDGLWARAPYLHNGSVPTISHLLIPESRPDIFMTGNLQYDQESMGFVWDQEGATFDTSIRGYSNAGHDDIKVFNGGIDFRKHPRKLEALIEYLKTL